VKRQQLARVVPGSLILALGLSVWFYAGTFPELGGGHPGPGLFPRLVAAGLFFAGLGLTLQALRKPQSRQEQQDGPPRRLPAALRVAAGLGLVVLYPLLQDIVGFILTVSSLSFGVALLLGVRPLTALVTAVAGGALIYLFFTRLLGVPL
jgi:putative tricarboxylic transport membrane protein